MRIVCTILCMLAIAMIAYSQAAFTGTILGTVTDQSGAVLPGVSVTVINQATGERESFVSDDSGNYVIANLKPGSYQLQAELAGFKRYTRTGLVLNVDQKLRIDVTLNVGDVSEDVEVVAGAPLLQTESASLGQVISNRNIVDLPLNGRNPYNLIALVPGVTEGSSSARGASVRINGGRNRTNEIQLDGVSALNFKGGGAAYTPGIDALREFKVITNSFAAEYGRTGGGVILATIKSGSNAFHGTLFEFFRNDALNTRNFFSLPGSKKPVLRYNQFGFALGGPIRKDATFFFVDWERTLQRTARTITSTVPTEKQRAGDFSEPDSAGRNQNTIYDPRTVVRTPFPGNKIDPVRFDPPAAKILAFSPLPNKPGLVNNFVYSAPGRSNGDKADLRIDHRFRADDRFVVRHSFSEVIATPTPTFPTVGNPENYPSRDRLQNTMISHTFVFSPTVLNESRLGFNRVHTRDISPSAGQNFPQQLGVPNVPQDVFPLVSISGFTDIGNQRSRPTRLRVSTFQFADNATFIRGNHIFKTGLDFRWNYMNNFQPTNPSGQLTFQRLQTGLLTPTNTGLGLASFLLGLGGGFQLLPGLSSYLSARSYDFYVQDDIKLRKNLTLNAGIRYEPGLHFVEKYNRISSFNPQKQKLETAGVDGAPRHFYRNDFNNFGPRLGLAWNVSGNQKTVVRLGYGVFYTTAPVASNPGTPLEAPFPWALSINIPQPQVLTDPWFVLSRFQGGSDPGDVSGKNAGEIVFFDPDSKTPYMQSWNLAIQKDLGKEVAFETAYAGTKGTKLYTPGSSFNQLPPELLGPPEKFGGLTAQQRRPFPEFQGSIALNTFGVSSIYHSLQVKIEKRSEKGLSFLTAYTWSKSIDNGSGLFPGDNPNISNAFRLQNRYDMRSERAISADDQTHRLTAAYGYEFPVGRGQRWGSALPGILEAVAGGWRLMGITQLRGGLPFGVENTPNTTNSLGGRQRADRIREGSLPRSQRTLQRFFDTAAFVAPAPFTFGNAARNVLRAPGLVNFDFALDKRVHVNRPEGSFLELRIEAFNAMNTPPFGFPSAAVGDQRIGQINSAGDGRIFQLGLKMYF